MRKIIRCDLVCSDDNPGNEMNLLVFVYERNPEGRLDSNSQSLTVRLGVHREAGLIDWIGI